MLYNSRRWVGGLRYNSSIVIFIRLGTLSPTDSPPQPQPPTRLLNPKPFTKTLEGRLKAKTVHNQIY